MKGEAAVAILASEGLAQVAVSCQHARRSSVPFFMFDCFLSESLVFSYAGARLLATCWRVHALTLRGAQCTQLNRDLSCYHLPSFFPTSSIHQTSLSWLKSMSTVLFCGSLDSVDRLQGVRKDSSASLCYAKIPVSRFVCRP